MDIKDINCSSFSYNPKDKDFVDKLEQVSSLFKIDVKGLNKKKFLTYVALMYDGNSELRRNISSLPARKMIAGLASGFVLDENNRFPSVVEDALTGRTIECARACAEYSILSQGFDATLLANYQRVFIELVALSHDSDKIKDTVGLFSKVRQETEKLEAKMLGGDETDNMRRALYLSAKSLSLGIQIEDIVDRIAKGDDLRDCNPHPGNYKPNKLIYAGETAPESEV